MDESLEPGLPTSPRLPDVITVVENLDDLKDRWKTSQIILVSLGLGIPYLIYDAFFDKGDPTPASVGAVRLEDLNPLVRTKHIYFDSGHPRMGLAYARYPADEARFVAVRDFHRTVIYEKHVEAIELLLALGAVDIEVLWRVFRGSELEGAIDVNAEDLVRLGVSTGATSTELNTWYSEIQGADGRREDRLPDLKWLELEPSFRATVAAADHRAQSFLFSVSSDDTTVVSAALVTALKRLDFDLGGEYKRWDNVICTIRVHFRQDDQNHSVV